MRQYNNKFISRLLRLSVGAIALAGVALGSQAATKTWGGTTDNWSNASAWSPTGVPATTDDVVINSGTVTVDIGSVASANPFFNSLTCNGGAIVIPSGRVLSGINWSTTNCTTSSNGMLWGYGTSAGASTYAGPITLTGSTASFSAGISAQLYLSGGMSGNYPVAFTFGTGSGNSVNGDVYVDGNINIGNNTVTKDGVGNAGIYGTLYLRAASSYTGVTQINSGRVIASNATALGDASGGTVVASGAALGLTGGISVGAEALTVGGTGVSGSGALYSISGTNSYGGAITQTAATQIGVSAGTLTLSGGITGAFPLSAVATGNLVVSGIVGTGANTVTKSGTGAMTLSAANTYSGATSITAGTLIAANNTALGTTASGTTVSSGAALGLQGGITVGSEALSIAGTGLSSAGALYNVSGINSYAGAITQTAASSIGSTAGTLTLSGGISGNFALSFVGAGDTTVSGIIGTGANTLSKSGAGTLTLGGVNTYSGATTVSAGKLLVTGSTAAGATTVASGATLGGTGTLNNTVTVQSGGRLSPGLSPGAITMSSLALASGSNLDMELGQAGVEGGSLNDLVQVTGALTLSGGTVNLSQSTGGTLGVGTYTLITYGSCTGCSAGGLSIGTTANGLAYTIDYSTANKVNLVVSMATYWDGSNTTRNNVVDGGTGVWDSTSTNWTTSTGAANGAWQGGTNVATFAGATGTYAVSLSSTQSIGGLTFNSGTYTLSSSTLTGAATSNVLTAASGVTATINSGLTGSNGFDKQGPGTIILGGSNTFTGTWTISAGTLEFAADALPWNSWLQNTTVKSGGTLSLKMAGDYPTQPVGQITLESGATLLSENTGGYSIINQPVTVAGSTNITMTSANAASTLLLDYGLKGSGTVTMTANKAESCVDMRYPTNTFSGTVVVAGTASTTLATGSGVCIGGATTSLQNADFTVNGTLLVGQGSVGYSGFGDLTIGALSGAGVVSASSPLSNPAQILSVGGTNASATFTGTLFQGVSTLSFRKVGTGTQTMSGTALAYSGTTTVSGGTLKSGANGMFPTASATTVASGATLDLNGFTQTLSAGLSSSGTLALGTGGVLTLSAGTSTINAITGSGKIIVQTGATLTLTAAIVNSNVTIELAGGRLNLGAFTHSLGTLTVSGSGASTLDFASGTAKLGVGNLDMPNAGTQTLTVSNWTKGTDQFTATNINSGTGTVRGYSTAPLNRITMTGSAAAATVWTATSATPANEITTGTATVAVRKITTGAYGGPFSFTRTNLASAPAAISTTGTGIGSAAPTTPTAIAVTTLGTAVTLTETPVSPYTLTSASCTDSASASTGNTGTIGTVSGNVLTIPAANVVAGAVFTCDFTNNYNSLTYWDSGTANQTANSVVNDGAGTWNTTLQNWTNSGGTLDGLWDNSGTAVAVFGTTTSTGTPGTVTVTNTGLSIGGITFGKSGYTLSGGTLTGAATTNVLTIGSGNTATINSALAGNNSFEKQGAGTITLSGAAGYTGATTVTAGTLKIVDGGSLDNTSVVNIASGATLAYNLTSGTNLPKLAGAGTIELLDNGALSYYSSDSMPSTGFTGTYLIDNRSVLRTQATDVFGTAKISVKSGGSFGLIAGAVVSNVTVVEAEGVGDGSSGGISVQGLSRLNSPVTMTGDLFAYADQGEISGKISGAYKLTTGTWFPGYLTLSGNNDYSGQTLVGPGRLIAAHSNALGSVAGGTIVSAGGALALRGDIAIGAEALTISGTGTSSPEAEQTGVFYNRSGNNSFGGVITLAAASTIGSTAGTLTLGNTIGTAGFALTFNNATGSILTQAAIGGGGSLTKSGTGTTTLGAVNTYGGATSVSAGTLKLGVASALPTASATTVASGATLDLNSLTQTLSAGMSNSGTLELGTGGVLTLSGGTSTISAITGSGKIIVQTGATLTLTAAIVNTGVTIELAGGRLNLGAFTHSLGTLTVSGSGASTLDFASGTAKLGVGNLDMTTGTPTLTVSNWTKGTDQFTATNINGGTSTARNANTAPLNRITLTGSTATATVWTATSATPANEITTGAATVAVRKITTGAAGGPFSFTRTNLASAPAAITTSGIGSAEPASPTAIAVTTLGTAVTLTETVVSPYTLTTAFCTDSASSSTGNIGNIGTLVGNVLTIPAVNVVAGATFTCDFTNTFVSLTHWDGPNTAQGGSTTGGDGGNGNWDTTGTNWTSATGVPNGIWDNTHAATAVFEGTVGTVNVGTVNAGGLTFSTTGYTLSGGTITGTATSNVLTAGTGVTATVGSALAGSNSFDKQGAGKIIISGANTFSGAWTATAGTLEFVSGTFPSWTQNTTVKSGATLSMKATADASTSATGQVTLESGAALTPENTGGWTILNQALTVGGTTSITMPSTNAAAPFILDGGLKGSGTVTMTSNKAQSCVLMRGSSSTFAGTVTVAGTASTALATASGVCVGGAGTSLQNADFAVNGTLLVGQPYSYVTVGNVTVGALSGAGVVTAASVGAGSNTLSVGGSNASGTFSGTLAQGNFTLSLTKVGTGTQTMSGTTMSYTGATTVSNGSLRSGANGVFPTASVTTVASGATLDLNGFTQTLSAGLNSSGTLALGTGGVLTLSAGTSTINAITGSGKIIVQTGATLTFTAAIVNSNVTIELAGGTLNLGAFTHSLGTLTVSGSGASTLDFASGTAKLGVGNLDMTTGTPTLTLSNWTKGTDEFTATNINSGTATARNVSTAPLNRITLTGSTAAATVWTATSATPANEITTGGATVAVRKTTNGGYGGPFSFTQTNLASTPAAISTDSIGVAKPTAPTGIAVTALGTAVTLTETVVSPYTLATAFCTDSASLSTGNTGNIGTLVGNVLTIPAVNVVAGATFTCDFTNTFVSLTYWDSGTTDQTANSVVNDGAGTWSTTLQNWTNSGGTADGTWDNSGTAIAVFGTSTSTGTPGAVAVSGGGVSIGGLTFGKTGYSIASGSLIGAATSNVLTAASGVSASISAALTGSNGFDKQGAGTIRLSGANTFTGSITVTGGTLEFYSFNGLSYWTTPTTVKSGATLSVVHTTDTVGSGTQTVTLESGATLNNENTGGWTLIKQPIVSSGSTSIVQSGSSAAAKGFFVDGGISGSGTLTLAASKANTCVVLRKTTNTFTGTIVVDGVASSAAGAASGACIGGSGTSLQGADFTVNGTLLLSDGSGVTDLTNGGNVSIGALNGAGVVSGIAAGAQANSFSVGGNNASGTFSGVIASGANQTLSLVKAGTGTQTLSTTNTYTGTTTVSGGVLRAGANGVFPTASATTVAGGATLDLNGKTQTFSAGLSSSGTLALGTGGVLTLSGSTSTISAITGSGKIIVQTGATLTLTAAIVNTGVTIELAGGTLNLGAFTHSLGTLTVSGSGASTLDFASGTAKLGVGNLDMTTGTPTLTVSNWTKGTDEFTATNINGGTAITRNVNTAPLNRITLTGSTSAATVWTGTGATPPNEITTGGATVAVRKITVGHAGGPFSFTQTNLASAPAAITTADASATPTTPTGIAVTTIGTAVTLTEAVVSPYSLTSVICTDSASGSTGNTGNIGTLSGNVLTIPAANVVAGATFTCDFTNSFASFTYWDSGTIDQAANSAVNDGAGTWNTTLQNWTNSGGTTDGVWDNSGTSIAVFGTATSAGTPGTVTASTGLSIGGLTFGKSGYVLAGGAITGAATTNVLTVNSGVSATVSNVLAGNAFDKQGAGTITLTGANTYTGATSVTAGTLQVGAGGTSGTIDSSSSVSVAGGATLRFSRSDASTISKVISGSGSLFFAGGGTFTVSGVNTFTGTVDITGATVTASAANNDGGAFGTATSVTVNNGGILRTGSANGVFGPTYATPASLTINTGGKWDLVSGPQNWNGNFTLAGGELASSATANPFGNLFYNGSSVSVTANSTISAIGVRGVWPINVSSGVTLSVSGAFEASSSITKSGAGLMVMSGTSNTYTGATTVSAGTLRLDANGALPAATATTVSAGATLNLNGKAQTLSAGLTDNGNLDLGTGGVLTLSAGSSTIAGAGVTGSGKIVVQTGATLTLTSALANSGVEIELAGGTLNLGNFTHSLGKLTVSAAGSTLDFSSSGTAQVTAGTLAVNASTTLAVTNWTRGTDKFFATAFTGATAGAIGATPVNQITMGSYSTTLTVWQSDTEVNVLLNPKVRVAKTSLGGAGSFTFSYNGLSSTGETITTSTAGATVQGLSTIVGTSGVAATLTESNVPTGWPATPSSASCRDANGTTTGNGTSDFGTLSGAVLTIAAANMKQGADITCTFVNGLNGLTGYVFNDGGAPSGLTNTGTPNDGIRNGSEAGVSTVLLTLSNCAGSTLATATTDGNGAFNLNVPGSVTAGTTVCLAAAVPGSYLATGANAGGTAVTDGSTVTVGGVAYTYSRASQRLSFPAPASGSLAMSFGMVPRSTFSSSLAQTGAPGTPVTYGHQFIAGTGGSVVFSTLSEVSTPTNPNATWSGQIYADPGCTNSVQTGATLLSPGNVPTTVVQGQTVCVALKEQIPANEDNNTVNQTTLQAAMTFSNASPGLSASYTLVDTTTVSDSALSLVKEVRNVTTNGAWSASNQAKSGQTLEYRITYTNKSAAPMTKVQISDVVPAYTTFVSATAGTPSPGLGNCTMNTPQNPVPATAVSCSTTQAVGGTGAVKWIFDGTLISAGTGEVTFRVQVD